MYDRWPCYRSALPSYLEIYAKERYIDILLVVTEECHQMYDRLVYYLSALLSICREMHAKEMYMNMFLVVTEKCCFLYYRLLYYRSAPPSICREIYAKELYVWTCLWILTNVLTMGPHSFGINQIEAKLGPLVANGLTSVLLFGVVDGDKVIDGQLGRLSVFLLLCVSASVCLSAAFGFCVSVLSFCLSASFSLCFSVFLLLSLSLCCFLFLCLCLVFLPSLFPIAR